MTGVHLNLSQICFTQPLELTWFTHPKNLTYCVGSCDMYVYICMEFICTVSMHLCCTGCCTFPLYLLLDSYGAGFSTGFSLHHATPDVMCLSGVYRMTCIQDRSLF